MVGSVLWNRQSNMTTDRDQLLLSTQALPTQLPPPVEITTGFLIFHESTTSQCTFYRSHMSTTMKTSFALFLASVSTASAQLVDVYKNSLRTLLEQEAMSAETQISLGMILPRLKLKSIYLYLCLVVHKRLVSRTDWLERCSRHLPSAGEMFVSLFSLSVH
jgi:hypothetical protein